MVEGLPGMHKALDWILSPGRGGGGEMQEEVEEEEKEQEGLRPRDR